MENGITRKELNGLGGRVTEVQLEVAEMKGEVKRNTGDVQVLFSTASEIKKSVDRGKWQVLVMVAIPVIILIVQLLSKGKGGN